MNIKRKGYLAIAFSLIGGAMLPIALKVAAGSSVNIFAFIFLAYLIATPVSFAIVMLRGKGKRLAGYMKSPKEYLLIGALGFANLVFVDYVLIYAERFVSAPLATIVYRLSPLLMLAFMPLILRERVSKIQIAALMLAFAGIYIIFSGGGISLSLTSDAPILLLLLLMTVISAFSTIALKRYTTDMESTMFIFNSFALIVSGLVFVYVGAPLPEFNLGSIVALLYVAVVVNAWVPFFYYTGFRILKTTFVANLYTLSPLITILASAVLLGEPVFLYYIVVPLLVAAGIVMQQYDKKGSTYIAMKKDPSHNFQIFDVTGAFVNNYAEGFYQRVRGGGRALAIKLDNGAKYENAEHGHIFERKNCLAFTNVEPHGDSKPEEISFINDVMGVKEGGTVLIAVGDPGNVESAFEEFAAADGDKKSPDAF